MTRPAGFWPYNYHAHTRYGDGHSNSADYAEEAIRRGMVAFGLSEHAPLGEDIDWTMAPDRVTEYREEVLALRRQYGSQVEVLCGLECDWWPARAGWWERIDPSAWDYLIGSVHYVTTDAGTWSVDNTPPHFEQGLAEVFGGDIRAACDAFFECERHAAGSGRFHILGHFDLVKKFNKGHRYFDPHESWYREMAHSVVPAAAASDIVVEVNTAGLDKAVGEYYPAPWLVEECVRQGVRLTLNADAHAAQEIQRHFDEVVPELARLGARELWRFSEGQWSPVPVSQLMAD